MRYHSFERYDVDLTDVSTGIIVNGTITNGTIVNPTTSAVVATAGNGTFAGTTIENGTCVNVTLIGGAFVGTCVNGTSLSNSTSSGNSTSPATSASSSPAVPAALGAVLGVVILASLVIIALLIRRNRSLVQDGQRAREVAALEQIEANYALESYGKDTISQEDSPEQLKRQLADVRKELLAVSVLAPSTIRDQSDYVREMTFLNDSIRQVSMRINRAQPNVPAATIRVMLCSAVWKNVFAKFDAGLDAAIDYQLGTIFAAFDKPSTAAMWKALTVKSLPLGDGTTIAAALEAELTPALGGGVQPGITVDTVNKAVAVSRMLSEDGKGYTIFCEPEGQVFHLRSADSAVVL